LLAPLVVPLAVPSRKGQESKLPSKPTLTVWRLGLTSLKYSCALATLRLCVDSHSLRLCVPGAFALKFSCLDRKQRTRAGRLSAMAFLCALCVLCGLTINRKEHREHKGEITALLLFVWFVYFAVKIIPLAFAVGVRPRAALKSGEAELLQNLLE
jgi:hypothetical protein